MPTLEEMRDYIQLRDMDFPRRSRVKEKDLIEDAGRTSKNNALV